MTAATGSPAPARAIADAVLVSAGLVAGVVMLTNPPLRRLALRGVRLWLGASVPGYLLAEVQRAWIESASDPQEARERP